MKQILFIIIGFASFSVQGQDSKTLPKILIGFNFSPDYSFRSHKNSDGNSSTDLVIQNRKETELAKFGYTTGLNILFNFSQLIGFETGIQYSNKGYKTKKQDLIFIPPNPASPSKVRFTYAYQYIGIPLKAKFTMGKSKMRFLTSIGFMTNFLLNTKHTANYEYSNGSTEKKTESSSIKFNKIDISPMMSIGVDYKLNNKIHISAEPTFRYGVIKIKDAPVAERLWNAGLNFSCYYILR